MLYFKFIFLLAITVLTAGFINAQTINWSTLKKDQKHIAGINIGAEHGLIFGAEYGYQLKTKHPVLLNAGISIPSGKILADDYKTKTGVQIRWFKSGNFHFETNTQAIFRRYENDYARLLNFGADVSAVAGYYRHKWFAAAEAGFDKAIITHFKNTALLKDNYPGIKDGWYEPSSGGNLFYGLQTGYSTKKTDIFIKAGKIVTQDFKTQPTIPFYVRVGVLTKLK